MKHAEVVIARQALEEGRGLVVIVNKMDLLRGKQKSKLYEDVIKAVPEELKKLMPQVCLFGTFCRCFLLYVSYKHLLCCQKNWVLYGSMQDTFLISVVILSTMKMVILGQISPRTRM